MILESTYDGFLSIIEGSMLELLASKCKTGCIVQIGCLKGRSSDYIVRGKQSTTLAYLIDINILDEMSSFNNRPNVHMIKGSSHDKNIVDTVPVIELLFIDGDHSQEGCSKDIELWYPKVMSGGVIVIHDVYDIKGFCHQPGVVQAVFHGFMLRLHELIYDKFIYDQIHRVDTCLIIQKK